MPLYRSRVLGASFAARVRSQVATNSRNGVAAERGSMKSPEPIAAACADSQRAPVRAGTQAKRPPPSEGETTARMAAGPRLESPGPEEESLPAAEAGDAERGACEASWRPVRRRFSARRGPRPGVEEPTGVR